MLHALAVTVFPKDASRGHWFSREHVAIIMSHCVWVGGSVGVCVRWLCSVGHAPRQGTRLLRMGNEPVVDVGYSYVVQL